MNLLKKCTAMLLTGAITLSCAACSGEDTAWIMRNGELEMPAGAYINSLIESYYEASSLVEDSEKDVLKQQIDGKDADEWIKEEALKATKPEHGSLCKIQRTGTFLQ